MSHIDEVVKTILIETQCTTRNATNAARALDDAGHLLPGPLEPLGYNAGLPWWGACDTEVRPAGYEQRVICTDENGPWETSAADARALAYALLAAADYTERNA